MKSSKNNYFSKLCEEYGVLVKPGTGKILCRGQEVDERHAVSSAFTDMMAESIIETPKNTPSDVTISGSDEMTFYYEQDFLIA